MGSSRKRWSVASGLLLLAALCALLRPAGLVSAHANLVRSEPVAGAALDAAPRELLLEFSEGLDPAASSVVLLDSSGRTVADGPGEVDAEQAQLRLRLGALPKGSYSAVWQARSTVDGHVTRGTVGFSVGVPPAAETLLPPVGTPDPATALPQPLDALARWLSYLSVALLLGSLAFALLVRHGQGAPGSRRPEARPAAELASVWQRGTLLALVLSGAGGLAVATLLFGLATALEGGVGALGGRTGLLLALRLALGLLAGWLARRGRWAAGIGAAALALLTFSLQGHGAALGSPLLVVLSYLHILAMGLWLGGLLPLLFLLRRAPSEQWALPVARFSRLALLAVALVALSGLGLAWAHVGDAEALRATSYGRALILKAALLLPLLGLGALNLLLARRVSSGSDTKRAYAGLRRNLGVELMLGGLLLLAAGGLMGVAPAREALAASERLGLRQQATQDQVELTLLVAPARIGDNAFAVDVADGRGGAEAVPAEMLLRLSMAGHDMGVTQVALATQDGQRYVARGSYLAMAGVWQAELVLRRAGFDDVRATFALPLR
jgi:copper transport protein